MLFITTDEAKIWPTLKSTAPATETPIIEKSLSNLSKINIPKTESKPPVKEYINDTGFEKSIETIKLLQNIIESEQVKSSFISENKIIQLAIPSLNPGNGIIKPIGINLSSDDTTTASAESIPQVIIFFVIRLSHPRFYR